MQRHAVIQRRRNKRAGRLAQTLPNDFCGQRIRSDQPTWAVLLGRPDWIDNSLMRFEIGFYFWPRRMLQQQLSPPIPPPRLTCFGT